MAANQVVLYFDNQEDALLFTLAASSVISADKAQTNEAVMKVAQKISKASRITTEGRGAPDDDLIVSCYMSNDFREGMTAFFEKRPANWTGS